MADQIEDASGSPGAQMVGNAFVEQYYCILHQKPEDVHRFYLDSSVLTRPGPDGVMRSITTVQAINEKMLSLDYLKSKAEILSADAEYSYKDGVIVLVTGILTGKDDTRRKFSQAFFLAPQENGYFVLNDVFRYVGESESESVGAVSVENNHIKESEPKAPLTIDPEPTVVADHPVPNETITIEDDTAKNNTDGKEVSHQLANGKLPVSEKKVIVEQPIISNRNAVPLSKEDLPKKSEDVEKKSFASVVKTLKDNNAPFQRNTPVKPPVKPAELAHASAAPAHTSAAPEATAPSSNSTVEKIDDHAVKAHAIFVPNLPMDATVEQLEVVFKKYGSIKPDGIQVRSNKQQGSCFGFVEFESASSMQNAIKESPISMFNRKLHIEERRASNDRGKFSGRGGYRNDNFRGRGNFNGGNFGGGRGYGRNDFERRGGFSNRTHGNGGRNGETGQRVYQNGGGRATRQADKVE
ncbi:putative G3BP-like protein [Fagus crenata]